MRMRSLVDTIASIDSIETIVMVITFDNDKIRIMAGLSIIRPLLLLLFLLQRHLAGSHKCLVPVPGPQHPWMLHQLLNYLIICHN